MSVLAPMVMNVTKSRLVLAWAVSTPLLSQTWHFQTHAELQFVASWELWSVSLYCRYRDDMFAFVDVPRMAAAFVGKLTRGVARCWKLKRDDVSLVEVSMLDSTIFKGPGFPLRGTSASRRLLNLLLVTCRCRTAVITLGMFIRLGLCPRWHDWPNYASHLRHSPFTEMQNWPGSTGLHASHHP